MYKEIRVYYESYEQAVHFIGPIIRKATDIPIRFIKKSRDHKKYSKSLASIVFWKDQDILISIVDKSTEIPLAAIEFSTAVFTEDHELQRVDALASAVENNCLYIKISSTKKKSPLDHGGNINFDYLKPYRLMFHKTGVLSFHIEWPLYSNSKTFLKTDPTYFSCPPNLPEIEEIFSLLFNADKFSKEWAKNFSCYLVKNKAKIKNNKLRGWLRLVDQPIRTKQEFLITSSTRTNIKDSNTLELKFNRFGHAMDPERGMLVFYGKIFQKIISKMIFTDNKKTWYKDIPQEEKIHSYIRKYGLKLPKDFLYAFLHGTGLHKYSYFKRITEEAKTAKAPFKLNINKFVQEHYFQFTKPLRSIFRYSNSLAIYNKAGQEQVVLVWNNKTLPQSYLLSKYSITPITEKQTLDEDDITYVVAHQVLKPNGFKILSISYPGAQGDRAILPEYGKGRGQQRKYIDIIAILPKKVLDLTENKGAFSKRNMEKDANKLRLYKKNKIYEEALRKMIKDVMGLKEQLPIILSLGF